MFSKKNIITSFIVAAIYLIASNILFYYHVFGIGESFINSLGTALTLPAIIMFGAGYAGGDGPFYLTTLIIFCILWLLMLPLVYLFSKLFKNKQ